jgi:mono/diheme cytochrome c family protein
MFNRRIAGRSPDEVRSPESGRWIASWIEPRRLETKVKQLTTLGSALALVACQQQPLVKASASTAYSRGHEYAQASCSACHAIGSGSTSPNPKAPPFAAVVNQDGLTKVTLSSWLRDAHNYPGEMDFQLDQERLDALVDYMLTLRDPAYRPVG